MVNDANASRASVSWWMELSFIVCFVMGFGLFLLAATCCTFVCFLWKLSLNDATDMLTAGCWPRRCGWSGDTRTHHARTGAGLRGGTTGIPPLAEAAPLREEGRSVRPQA